MLACSPPAPTSADTVSITGQTFTTGSADLKFGQCGEIGDNCLTTPATSDTLDLSGGPFELTGPGHRQSSGCLVVENKGNFLLHV